jgi:hypothetical protein
VAHGASRDVRAWALAELICAALTLATLALALGALAASPWVRLPAWITSWPMQILLAGAVGYGTNFLAVQMLFKPRAPVTWWPMRWVWPQGLVPAKQQEMARVVGEEVAGRLLTPEVIVEEMASLVEAAFADEATVRRVQDAVLPLLRRELPAFLRRFLPEGVEAVRDAARACRRRRCAVSCSTSSTSGLTTRPTARPSRSMSGASSAIAAGRSSPS